MDLKKLEKNIINGYRISKQEAYSLSSYADKEALYGLANNLRKYFFGNNLDTCSIMNARSGKCSEDCKWCSQSAYHNTNVEVYPLISISQAVEMARKVKENEVRKFSLVTSGRDIEGKDLEKVCDIYRAIAKDNDIYLCASMGLIDFDSMKQLHESGVKRYHCNIETSPSFFPKLCTTHTMEEKIETIKYAQKLGMEVCSGGIVGMGESMKDRIEMAITLRELSIKSIPVNVLNPIKGTPLENTAQLSADELLTIFALFKIINPEARIRFAGGRQIFSEIQKKALFCGVDAAMIGDLLTTVGANSESDKLMFEQLGLQI